MFVGSPNSTAATAVPTLTSVTSLGQAARLKYWSWTTRYFQLRLPRQRKKNFSSSDWFPSWRTWKSLTQNWNKSGVIYFEYGVEAWMCLFGWYFLTVCALKTDFILNTYRHYQVYSSDNTNRATPLIIYWLYRAVHKYSPSWTFPHFVAGSPFDQRMQTIWIFLPILLGGKKKLSHHHISVRGSVFSGWWFIIKSDGTCTKADSIRLIQLLTATGLLNLN